VFWGYIGINLSVCLSIFLVSAMTVQLLLKLYTVVENNLRMCMKEADLSLIYNKGDNSRVGDN